MFRENVLTKPEIIERISETMIPVALNYEKVQDSTSAEAKFLQPLLAQRAQDQGVWIFSPAGKALGGFVGFGDMAGETRKVIDNALRDFGSVKLRKVQAEETHPRRGRGVMSDGSVLLAEYVRRWGSTLHSHGTSPVLSTLMLDASEFKALAPREAIVGSKWTLPEMVAKKFCRLTSPFCYQHAPQPDWVTAVRIDARVRAVQDGVVQLDYEGRIASVHHGRGGQKISTQETKLTGEGVYDLETMQMRSVLMVGAGTLLWTEVPDQLVTFNALVEWSRSNGTGGDDAGPGAGSASK